MGLWDEPLAGDKASAFRTLGIALLLVIPAIAAAGAASPVADQLSMGDEDRQIKELPADAEVPSRASCDTLQEWYDKLLERYEPGTAIPLQWTPTDEELAEMGLPPAEELVDRRFPQPTAFLPDGSTEIVDAELLEPQEAPVHHKPGHDKGGGGDGGGDDGGDGTSPAPNGTTLATFGGSACLGIRPGALLLNTNGYLALCSMAHAYGSPGSYQISTAGHCTSSNEVMTVVAFLGDRSIPVLLDFGTTSTSHNNGIGDDYALIDVDSQYQDLVSATMCFWGGPYLGVYDTQGVLVQGTYGGQGPGVEVNPDPTLVQGIVHYGHGLVIGTGGTPRAGGGASWGSSYFVFASAIAPGDSGSGANTATTEAAGIITHLIVDPLMRQGVGVGAGTRTTAVGTPAMGWPVGVPAPLMGK